MFGGWGRGEGGGPIPPQRSPKGTNGAGGSVFFQPSRQGLQAGLKLKRKTVHTHFLVDKELQDLALAFMEDQP